MSIIQQQKKELRKKIATLKEKQSNTDKLLESQLIFSNIDRLEVFKQAQTIMLYWSMNDEVYTHDFIKKWYHTKTILLPVVDGNNLRIKQYKGKESMQAGENYGILEPTGLDFKSPALIDIIIVPGIAFDKNNNRMGRGKGYYDKLLETSNALKIGVCFKFQLVEQVPVESHDLRMDLVIHK